MTSTNLAKNAASGDRLMLRYRVRLNQMDFYLFVFFPIAELKYLDGRQGACFTRFFPQTSSLPVLRPKGAELLHFLLFFLAGRGLGDATSPEPAWFHSKPDVSALPFTFNGLGLTLTV